ncbi:hypothetical protein C8Q76DRAFT_610352 [Earliella scabrosa]|nr:hypothetical protein C8Q76DRAFT_610352 [Earliella scabrosa]
MQNPSSYYAVPKDDGRIWADWSQSGRNGNYSWSSASSSSSTTLGEGSSSSRRRPMREISQAQCNALPISYTLTPPTPSATDSDASSSQISMESIPEYDEMPEIPFVSAEISYHDGWINPDLPPERPSAGSQTSFWSGIIGMRPSTSKSSTDSGAPVLGHTTARVLAPSRTRKRSGSVSSIASSRTRPPPAKSILSSSSSVRTRRRKAPSVKFLDMPTIHYEEDDYDHDHEREPSSCMSPPPPKKARGLGGFFSFKWLFGPSSSSSSSSSSSKTSAKKASLPERPSISGPFPLWDSPPRRTRGGGRSGGGSSAASLRSMKSSGSIRSMRSCSSRLPTPTYWPR